MDQKAAAHGRKRHIVKETVEHLRNRIFAQPAGEQIGSLPDLAKEFEVGIVTIQQAARVLEHEGILEVRRGPGGGYYGKRPSLTDLERVLSAYMRSEPASWVEVLDITSLLFNRLCAAAAECNSATLHEQLHDLLERIDQCETRSDIGILETALQNLLFKMVERPIFELLTRVVLTFAETNPPDHQLHSIFPMDKWKEGRAKIVHAILQRDPSLAHFEADRQNRQTLLALRAIDKC